MVVGDSINQLLSVLTLLLDVEVWGLCEGQRKHNLRIINYQSFDGS